MGKRMKRFIPKQLEESGICQGGAQNLGQASTGAEAVKLKKFSDAGGSQILRLSDAGRNRFFKLFRYILLSLFFLAGCFQAYDSEDDLRTVPVTNNPHVIPSHGSSLPGFGGGQQGPY